MRHLSRILLIVPVAAGLAGCDLLGIETTSQIAARKEAEGKAIGSGCRHAVRSIEDCFESNPRAGKAAVFAGWKEMDQYMRENAVIGMPRDLPDAGFQQGGSREPMIIEDELPDKGSAAGARRS